MVSFDAHLDWSQMSPGFEAWRDKLGRELDLGQGSRWLSFQRYVGRCCFINTSREKTGWLGWFIEGGWLDCCCFIDHSWESDFFKASRMSWKLMVAHFPFEESFASIPPVSQAGYWSGEVGDWIWTRRVGRVESRELSNLMCIMSIMSKYGSMANDCMPLCVHFHLAIRWYSPLQSTLHFFNVFNVWCVEISILPTQVWHC